MTTISSSSAYSLSAFLSQAMNRETAAGGSKQSPSSPATTSPASTSPSTIKDAIAAAARSGSFDFATVGQNARTVLDAGIADYGQTPGTQTTEQQWIKMFGGMDRRSLYSVASNQGGRFTAQEQSVAKTLMDNQLANAGDVDSAKTTDQQIAAYGQRAAYLNIASAEEKNSPAWAYSMADAQTAARMADINAHMPPMSNSSPLLSTLLGAMYSVRSQSSGAVNFGSVNSLADITSQAWARPFKSQIESSFVSSTPPATRCSADAGPGRSGRPRRRTSRG